jgi:hypothetical protein
MIPIPDVGKDLAMDVLQFVQPVHPPTSAVNHQTPHDSEILRIDESQRGRTVAHDQMRAIVGQPPTFALVTQTAQFVERLLVVDDGQTVAPSQLVDPVAEHRDPFAEQVARQLSATAHSTTLQLHPPECRLAVLTGAFQQKPSWKTKPCVKAFGSCGNVLTSWYP